LIGVAPAQDGVVDQGVLHVDHDGEAGVDPGQGLDREDGVHEAAAGAAVALRDFDAHQPELEQARQQRGLEPALLVHPGDERRHALARETEHRIRQQAFLFTDGGQCGRGLGSRGHAAPA